MGSPITFGGFNNIDFGVVLNAVMQQERAPLTAIEAQRSTLQAKNTAFSTFATKLAALESAAADLAGGDGLSRVSATSSNESAVGISAGSSSVTGRYEVVVSELARPQVMTSSSSYTSLDAVVATGGAISMAKFGDPPIDIEISGSMTLEQVAEAINQNSDAPVSASVVQVTPGQYRLVLTGRATGASGGFTVDSRALSGGQGLTFTDTDGNGVSGDTAADNVQQAVNAQLTVNQVAVTSASNTLTDVIPGVTLDLRKKDPDAVVTIDVSKDHDESVDRVTAFATAYNNLVAFVKDQNTAEVSGKPAIGRDPLVRGLRDALRSAIQGVEDDGSFTQLAEVGIGFDTSGKITIDRERLVSALNSSSTDVARLFGGADGSGGRFGAMKALMSRYTEAGGLVSDVKGRIDDQVTRIGARIESYELQLSVRRAALQREFIAADRAMSQLNNQGNSLSQLGGQFRLF